MPEQHPSPRLLLFDVNTGGHHAGYIAHIFRAWRTRGEGDLVAAVSPDLLRGHPELAAEAFSCPERSARFEAIPEALRVPPAPLTAKGWAERTILKRYVERLRPEQVLLMFADHTQFALATGIRFSYPVCVSMLMLRVSHHRERHRAESLRERLTQLRKRLVLRAAIRNPHTSCVFTGDRAAAEAIRALEPRAQAFYVPDPVDSTTDLRYDPPGESRARYGIGAERKVFLLFGVLAQRKGVLTVLEAIRRLPRQQQEAVALLLAGPVEPDLKPILPQAVADTEARTGAQVVLQDAFLQEPEIRSAMEMADVVLVPYHLHAGTSSVLIRAAAAARPVLAQDYGWIKEQVQTHHLGLLADTTRPDEVAAGMGRLLAGPPDDFDPQRARAFAATQTPDSYAQTIFDHLGLGQRPAASELVG